MTGYSLYIPHNREQPDSTLIGRKAANLAVLDTAAIAVPQWVAITSDAFSAFMQESGLATTIGSETAQLTSRDLPAVKTASQRIRKLVRETNPPPRLFEAAAQSLNQLWGAVNSKSAVVVRSSSVAEDTKAHSFAGQFDSYLGVKGLEQVVEAIKDCWGSSFSFPALVYRLKYGLPIMHSPMAVIIQKMVAAEISGVLFTANPVTRNTQETVINATYGLGEGVVGGMIPVDSYRIARGQIIEAVIATKTFKFQEANPDRQGTVKVPVPEALQKTACLTESHIRHLTLLGERIQRVFGQPQDVEWSMVGPTFWTLQTRPITTL